MLSGVAVLLAAASLLSPAHGVLSPASSRTDEAASTPQPLASGGGADITPAALYAPEASLEAAAEGCTATPLEGDKPVEQRSLQAALDIAGSSHRALGAGPSSSSSSSHVPSSLCYLPRGELSLSSSTPQRRRPQGDLLRRSRTPPRSSHIKCARVAWSARYGSPRGQAAWQSGYEKGVAHERERRLQEEAKKKEAPEKPSSS